MSIRRARVAQVEVTGAVYVLAVERLRDYQSPFVFRGMAEQVWRLIDGTRTEAQIVDELVGASGVEREVVARDTRDFLATLRGLGLVVDGDN